ncbi:hypothetical protein SAMN05216266_13331 [Amycolatopsis marina]|uniref:Uncharacterized protein n=1 Tax=Amycolatopsis marina TaxID=490629 RepID=A0A1I1CKB6_9PSEU|nr:hypothetical protein [Amycolatopsis marina]SFB63135.1 hypothetical protein SAMN05216266_13331 [Amycolatopsis marina]
MRTLLRSVSGWPLGRLAVLQPSLVIIAVVLAQTWPRLAWPWQEWIQTSQQFHEQLLLAAPIAAAAGTYYAGRHAAPDRIASQPWAPRAGMPIVLRHLRTLTIAFTISYLLGLLPLVAVTVASADFGGPHVLIMLTGVAGLIAAITVGYLIGVLAGTAWLAPITLVVTFVLMQSPHIEAALSAVTPVTHVPAALGETESVPLTWYRLGLFTLITVVAAAVAARALARQHRWKVPSPTTTAAAALTALAVAIPLATTPRLVTAEPAHPRLCRDVSGIEVCVHAGHRSQLPEIANAVTRIRQVTGDETWELRRLRDTALATPTEDPRRPEATTGWIPTFPINDSAYYAASAVAYSLSGLDNCDIGDTGEVSEQFSLAAELGDRLVRDAGYGLTPGEPSGRFDEITVTQLRDWMRHHRETIHACQLTTAQLP